MRDALEISLTQVNFLLNLVFTSGIFPDKWKIATLTPIPKQGVKTDVNNLRPISILPMPSKLIEKLIHLKLSNYLEENHILNNHQGGFRKGFSTIDTISKFTDDVALAINENKMTVATFIDFKKAFDTVDHKILLDKIENLGIQNKPLQLLKNYLKNRLQRTKVNGLYSDFNEIICGVPQGSILGPLLFIIYTNDIASVCKQCNFKCYADDTVVYFSSTDKNEALSTLQNDLDRLYQWCHQNKLTINIKKTKSMIFGTNNMTKKAKTLPMVMLNYQNMNEH